MAGQGLQAFEEKLLTSPLAKKKPLSSGILDAIIAAILAMLQGCNKPTPASFVRRLGMRANLAAAIKKQAPDIGWVEAFEHAENLLAVADSATPDEKTAFIADCVS